MSNATAISPWDTFRHKDFRYFFLSRFLSSTASQVNDVGVGWLIYQLTDSALALGLVGLCMFAPNILFALAAGHVADRFDRRLVLLICYCVMLLASLALYVAVLLGRANEELVFILVGVLGTAKAFSNPAGQAILPNLVPTEAFSRAVAMTSSAWQIATIAGPAIGGILYGFGADKVFLATSLFYLACVISLAVIRPGLRVRSEEEVTWAYLTAGIRYIWKNQMILGSISLDLFAVLLGGATALLPIYARDILMIGPFGLGLLRTAPALGAFTTAILLAHMPDMRSAGAKMFTAVGIYGVATIGFGLSTDFYLSFVCLIVLGAADMVSVFVRSTVMQIETPDDMRGRVSAVNTLFIGASNELGEFESGVLARFFGAVTSVVIGGVGSLIVTVAWSALFPQLRKRDRLANPQVADKT